MAYPVECSDSKKRRAYYEVHFCVSAPIWIDGETLLFYDTLFARGRRIADGFPGFGIVCSPGLINVREILAFRKMLF